jgi:hypothetical protein
MLRSLGKQLRRFARQGQTAKEGRMEKREASFASIEQELINLANSTPPYGAKVDSKMLVALSRFRNQWKSLFELAQALPNGEE